MAKPLHAAQRASVLGLLLLLAALWTGGCNLIDSGAPSPDPAPEAAEGAAAAPATAPRSSRVRPEECSEVEPMGISALRTLRD